MQPLVLIALLSCAQTDATEPSFAMWSDTISRYVRENVGRGERPLGYTAQEMAPFPGFKHRLGYVNQLFRDTERVPVESDRLARRMLDADFARATYLALGLLGARITFDAPPPELDPEIVPADAKSQDIWESLPPEVREAIAHVVRGAAAARPHLHAAFDWAPISTVRIATRRRARCATTARGAVHRAVQPGAWGWTHTVVNRLPATDRRRTDAGRVP